LRIKGTIIFIALLSLPLLVPPAFSQRSADQDLRRWLSKKPVIDSIVIEGNEYFSDSKIKGALFSRESNIFRAIKADRRRRVQRETLMKDTSAVKYLYLSSGFLGIKVSETFEPIPPDSQALIVINLEEGRQFFYDSVRVTGDYPPRFNKGLYEILREFKKGRRVDPFRLRQAIYDIKSILANNGYPYAQAAYFIDTSIYDELTNIVFEVESDSLVHFGDIKITGSINYDTSIVRRELTFEKGDIYRRKDLLESQSRLLNTGQYLTLRLQSEALDSSGTDRLNPDFRLSLREKNPHYVSIKTGAAQDSLKDLIWNFSASWGKRNFLGSRSLELSASSAFVIFTEWRLKSHGYRARITEPWFLGIRMPLTVTGEIEPGIRSLKQPYRIQTWSVFLTTTRTIRDKYKILNGFKYEAVNIYGVNASAQERIREEEGLSIRRKYYLTITRDSRNSLFIPNRGSLTGLRLEYVGGFLGGDDSFYLLEGSWSRYQKIWPGWIFATRLKTGYVQEFGDSRAVPTNDKFYLGGANTIRGFTEGGLGPTENGNLAGADIIVVFNQEFRFPLIGKLWGSIFSDVGNGYASWSDIKWNNLAVSYGFGIQFISPAGPIRLDYARRLRVKGIEPGDKYHFTILYAF